MPTLPTRGGKSPLLSRDLPLLLNPKTAHFSPSIDYQQTYFSRSTDYLQALFTTQRSINLTVEKLLTVNNFK